MKEYIRKYKYYTLFLIIIISYYSISHYFYTQHTSIDKIYIINLDRSPHRYKEMQKRLDPMNFPTNYIRFSAIDGKKLVFNNQTSGEKLLGQDILDKKIWLKGNFNINCTEKEENDNRVITRNLNQSSFNKRTPGEVGVSCSHKQIWQEIVKNGYKNTLILEDDIEFIPFF